MYCDILQNNFEIKQYSVKERKTLEIFLNHLEALYANTKTSAKKVDFEQCSTVDKIKIFGELFEETSQYNLKDRIVRSFCYSAGIKSFDELRKKMDEAVKECIRRGILADFLRKHRAEVKSVILTEYDREAHIRAEKKESWEDGWEDGVAEERERLLRSVIRVQRKKGQKEADIISFLAECFELPEEEAWECYRKISREDAL